MRIFLADDQPKVRSALRLLLEQKPGLHIVGEAAETESLLAGVQSTQPDLVLLDWELPGRRITVSPTPHPRAWSGNGRQRLLSIMRALDPQVVIVALSSRPGARREALAAGADAFVCKGDPPESLLATVDCRQSIGEESA